MLEVDKYFIEGLNNGNFRITDKEHYYDDFKEITFEQIKEMGLNCDMLRKYVCKVGIEKDSVKFKTLYLYENMSIDEFKKLLKKLTGNSISSFELCDFANGILTNSYELRDMEDGESFGKNGHFVITNFR